jgi:Lipocalin-like domain
MSIRMRAIVALALVVAGPVAAALAQGSSLKDQLVGQWQLVSIGINNAAPYGDSPTGSMLLDAAGHYSIIVISNGGARNISYYGTYTVDESSKSVTMHVAGGTRANADGQDQTRQVTVDGDQLVEQTPPGRKGSIKMTWKRAN